jgi:predicted transcriptional regulator
LRTLLSSQKYLDIAREIADNQKRWSTRRSNVALRLQRSLLEKAKRLAESEGVAVAEKMSTLRTEDYFRERASRANITKAKRILKRAGRGNPPVAGDEI